MSLHLDSRLLKAGHTRPPAPGALKGKPVAPRAAAIVSRRADRDRAVVQKRAPAAGRHGSDPWKADRISGRKRPLPFSSSASETAKWGMPWMKLVVPSRGSMTHRKSLARGGVAALLGQDAMAGELLQDDRPRWPSSASRSTRVTKSFFPLASMSTPARLRKSRQITSPLFLPPERPSADTVHAWFSSWRSI